MQNYALGLHPSASANDVAETLDRSIAASLDGSRSVQSAVLSVDVDVPQRPGEEGIYADLGVEARVVVHFAVDLKLPDGFAARRTLGRAAAVMSVDLDADAVLVREYESVLLTRIAGDLTIFDAQGFWRHHRLLDELPRPFEVVERGWLL